MSYLVMVKDLRGWDLANIVITPKKSVELPIGNGQQPQVCATDLLSKHLMLKVTINKLN